MKLKLTGLVVGAVELTKRLYFHSNAVLRHILVLSVVPSTSFFYLSTSTKYSEKFLLKYKY